MNRMDAAAFQQYAQPSSQNGPPRANGAGYSVSSTHDYLGYPKHQEPFTQDSLWNDANEKEPELW